MNSDAIDTIAGRRATLGTWEGPGELAEGRSIWEFKCLSSDSRSSLKVIN